MDFAGVAGVGVGPQRGGEDAVLRAHLDRHVGQHDPVVQREFDAAEFQRLVCRSIRPELPRERQRGVLRAHARRKLARQRYLDRFRHAQPDFAADQDRRQVARPDPGGERIHRAVRDRVAVGAEHEIPRLGQPLLQDELVSDSFSHLPYPNPLRRGEIANAPVQRRCRAIPAVVIQRKHHPVECKHALAAHSGEVVERHRDRPVGAHGAIHAADDHVAGACVAPRLRREDLLADGLAGHSRRYCARRPPPAPATSRPGMSAST